MTTGGLTGRFALVCGGGRGLGAAIALRFATAGAHNALAARTDSELQRTGRACRAAGVNCSTHVVDVADRDQVDSLVRGIEPVDVLVNCAGIHGPIGPFVENDLDEWVQGLRINLLGTVHTCKAVLPSMVKRGRGSIINLSGGGATAPRPNFSSYAVSKVAVVRFTETLAAELVGSGVRVNAIAPGAMDTRLQDSVLEAGERAGDHYQFVRTMRETGQGATPPELAAELALFLASEVSSNLTGKLISALHDPWADWDDANYQRVATSAWYTIRRLDPHTLRELGAEP
jgi:3-oxoacyl-[acyl-carrier protein] reductase